MPPLFETKNLGIQFGGLKAVDGFNLKLNSQELVGLIGPNGAGKTTVFNLLTGVYQPTQGEILLNGQSIVGLAPHKISSLGVARTFQNIRLFKQLTVLENVLISMHQHISYGMLAPLLRTPHFYKIEKENTEAALALLKIFNLDAKSEELAGSLPYGAQRKLEIVRALATKPKLILLDEPAAGLNHSETESLMKTITHIRKDFGLTVLLIEHDMKLVMGICERIFVLDHGVLIAEGNPQAIQNNKKVIEAYLGVEESLA